METMETKIEEKSRKRKDWIKNVAIIFLVIMLVLTFFSNTIMNYSLPEVSAQYSTSGNISSKIRGTGIVEAVQPYEVKVTEVRKVEEVYVKSGDTVKKGQKLFKLGKTDGSTITETQEALDNARYEYEQKLLGEFSSNEVDQKNIEFLKEDYKKARKAQTRAEKLETKVRTAKEDMDDAQVDVDEMTAEVAALTAKRDKISGNVEALISADSTVAEKQKAYDEFNHSYETTNSRLTYYTSLCTGYQKQMDAIREENPDGYEYIDEYVKLKKSYDSANSTVISLTSSLAAIDLSRGSAKTELTAAQNQAKAAINSQISKYDAQIAEAENSLTEAKVWLTEATAEYNDIKERYTLTPEAAKEAVEAARKALENAVVALNDKKGTQDHASQLKALELEKAQKNIANLEKKLTKLKKNATSKIIKSPVGGVVSSVAGIAGNNTTADTPLATIELVDNGYTVSLTVTTEQSRQVKEGTAAEVLNVWDSDVKAVLSKIKNDTESGGKNKTLVFQVSGTNISLGQQIELSVGDRTAFYETIVPNSSIHEDNKGKFILAVKVKDSPLGNRYTATRVDVEVVASDETLSAITGASSGGEFIITTSTKPLKAGMQVRMVEGGNS